MSNQDMSFELSKYRYQKAIEDLETAVENYQENRLRAANNRAYYSIFHALRSVLALENFDSKKHSGIISEFRKRHVKNGDFSKEISDRIETASIVRNASDYDDIYVVSRKETLEQIESAIITTNAVREYLIQRGLENIIQSNVAMPLSGGEGGDDGDKDGTASLKSNSENENNSKPASSNVAAMPSGVSVGNNNASGVVNSAETSSSLLSSDISVKLEEKAREVLELNAEQNEIDDKDEI